MPVKISEKIDRFMIIAIIAILVLALVLVYTVNSLFQSFFLSQKVTEPEKVEAETFFSGQKLDDAYKILQEKKNIQLDLKL